MFGIDSPELLVIAIVALIFIGPKELPGMLRTVGRWVATARNLASEFRGHVDDMVKQADLDEVKKTIGGDTGLDFSGVDPMKEIKGQVEAGIAEANAEFASAKSAIDEATTNAELPPPVQSADLVPPPTPEPIADPTPAIEPSAVVDPIHLEEAPVDAKPAEAKPDEAKPAEATPTAANEAGPPPPAKIAVG